jgi:hypothetical protein
MIFFVFWLMIYSDMVSMEMFAANYLSRFATNSNSALGVMLPLFCAFQTSSQINEWCHSIMSRFPHVDMLINYIDEDVPETTTTNGGNKRHSDASQEQYSSGSTATASVTTSINSVQNEFVSSTKLLVALCQSFSSICFRAQPTGGVSIVNITRESHDVYVL